MKNIFIYCVFLLSFTIKAQTFEVITNKGTLKTIDNSKWTLSGNDIFNKNSGNVGIGTTTPSEKLHVTGSIYLNAENSAFVVGAGTSSPLGFVKKIGSFPFIGAGNNTPIIFSQLSAFGQGNILGNIGSSFVERMRIDGTGNVGIGGSIPTSLLHLSGPTNFPAGNLLRYIQISNFNTGNTSNDGTIIGINAAGETEINNRETSPIFFSTSNAERMRIDANGNVGIGINNPTSRLYVQGDLRISGGFLDSSGDIGTAGQLLSSTGTLTDWVSTNALMWGLLGNSGTNPTTNFIGTTDIQDLVFRTNNIERLRLFNYASPIGVLGLGRNSLTGVNGGASTFSGPTLFFGDAGNISTNTGLDFIIDDDNNATNTQFTFKANGDGNIGTVELMQINENGRVGIGTTSPSQILSLGGDIARTFQMERHSIIGSAGNNLTVLAGGASSGTNLAGGSLILSSGSATGNGVSSLEFRTATAGVSGTADIMPTTKMTILGNGNVGIGITSPSVTLDVNGQAKIGTLPAGVLTEDFITADATGNLRKVAAATLTRNIYDIDGSLAGNRTVTQGTNTLNFTSTATTQIPFSITANNLTTGTGMSISSSNNLLSSGRLLDINYTGTGLNNNNGRLLSITGNNVAGFSGTALAEIQANELLAGSALAIRSTTTTGNNLSGSLLNISYAKSILIGTGRLLRITGDNITGSGTLSSVSANALTTGTGFSVTSTGNALTTGRLMQITGDNQTSGTLATFSANKLTSGTALEVIVGTDLTANGEALSVRTGNITAGSAIDIFTGTLGTAGKALNISSNNNAANTEGVIKVVNTAASSAGTFATFNANSTAGSGLTILNNGNLGIGAVLPTAQLHTTGTLRFEGIGMNTANTNILTTDSNGNVTTRDLSNFLSGSAITSLNGLTNSIQTFATGTSGTDFNINSSTATHTFNFPNASSTNRGLLSSADWTTFNNKTGTVTATTPAAVITVGTTTTINNTTANWNANQLQGKDIATTAPNDGEVLKWDANTSAWSPKNAKIFYVKSSNQINNLNNAFVDITDISANVFGGKRYNVECKILFTSNDYGNGSGIGLIAPVGIASVRVSIPTSVNWVVFGNFSSNGDNVSTTAFPNSFGYHVIEVVGVLMPSIDGVFGLNFRNERQNVGDSITLRAGSFCSLEEY